MPVAKTKPKLKPKPKPKLKVDNKPSKKPARAVKQESRRKANHLLRLEIDHQLYGVRTKIRDNAVEINELLKSQRELKELRHTLTMMKSSLLRETANE